LFRNLLYHDPAGLESSDLNASSGIFDLFIYALALAFALGVLCGGLARTVVRLALFSLSFEASWTLRMSWDQHS